MIAGGHSRSHDALVSILFGAQIRICVRVYQVAHVQIQSIAQAAGVYTGDIISKVYSRLWVVPTRAHV